MKIKPEVLVQLSQLNCVSNQAVIVEKLERKLYVEVDKVLQAIGGKWSRSHKAHIFDGDAQTAIDVAIATGEITTKREIGFFPTPHELARDLVTRLGIQPGEIALEPSAGTGNIVDELLYCGARVTAVERDAKMRAALVKRSEDRAKHGTLPSLLVSPVDDFMVYGDPIAGGQVDVVAMNPPFTKCGLGDHLDHYRHAFNLLRHGGRLAGIGPAGLQFREDRRHREFRSWVKDHGGEIESLPEGSFRESGTDVNTCIFMVTK